MPSSRVFDRAAGFYDATRSLPEEAMSALVPRLVDALGTADRVLEIGVGTGRIAIPLAQQGISVVGIDLSRPMLDVLRSKSSGVPVAIGDATRLPLPSASFAAAVASHVFHLIPNWESALDEVRRVVVPGGRLLASWRDRDEGSPLTAVRIRLRKECGLDREHIGAAQDGHSVDDALRSAGAVATEIEPVRFEETRTIAAVIDTLEQGIWSFTWDLDPEVLSGAAAHTRAWAAGEYGDLDAPIVSRRSVAWLAYVLP